MKLNSLLIMFVLHFPMLVFSQFKHDVGLSSSYRRFDYSEKQMNFTGEYNVHLNVFNAGVAIGAEYWYLNSHNTNNPNIFRKPSFTGKIEPWLGVETKLFHSNVFLSANIGARFYFLNQLRDSLSLYMNTYNNNKFNLTEYSREYIENLPNVQLIEPYKSKEYYVTKMPITFLTRVNLGYTFKRFKVSAFIMPYWVRFQYENAAFPERKGKTSVFFYDLGLGVNYTLPQKKKE